MLYSLVVKKLYGFASALGAILALVLFYVASVLPDKLGLMAAIRQNLDNWPGPPPTALLPLLFGGILSLAFFILPFWALVRMIRLTNTWIYPKLLKPLEEKI
jgi:hypothetical protein